MHFQLPRPQEITEMKKNTKLRKKQYFGVYAAKSRFYALCILKQTSSLDFKDIFRFFRIFLWHYVTLPHFQLPHTQDITE